MRRGIRKTALPMLPPPSVTSGDPSLARSEVIR
jgi:hypothetical protein